MACMCSVMSDSATPWPVPGQAPLSMQFSRQEYWSGLPIPSPGDLPNPGTEPVSLISCIGRCVLYHLHHLGSPNPYFLKYASCTFLRENYFYFLHCKVYHNFKYNIERSIIRSEHELLLGKEAETKEVNFFQRKKHKREEIINRNFP